MTQRFWFAVAVLCSACGGNGTTDSAAVDSGLIRRSDAGRQDASVRANDSGDLVLDSGSPQGPADSSVTQADADATERDSGVRSAPDASFVTIDAGRTTLREDASSARPDASTTRSDAGRNDSGPGGSNPIELPPPNAKFDYQLGESYTPPNGVRIVSRDREASPAAGLYNICYVNGFQTQPNEASFWAAHSNLLLRDRSGQLVIDPDWNETLLDITTEQKRIELAEIVGAWIDGCADAGFDAVEIDNLDTYSRSNRLVSEDDAVAFMTLLSARAHARGLAIAQKNSAEILSRADEMGTDFAVAEECNRWNECGDYVSVYGELVFIIEYRRADFTAGCSEFPNLSIILRDLNLVAPSARGYVYDDC